IEGMILLNHGLFTFHDDAMVSYENMIKTVTKAEEYLKQQITVELDGSGKGKVAPLKIVQIRQSVSKLWKKPILAQINNSEICTAFSRLPNLATIVNKGTLTPDHIIRTKRTPVVLSGDPEEDILTYANEYKNYFNEFNNGDLIALDPAPRWAVWPGYGTLSFGTTVKNNKIIRDITRHTMKAIFQAEQLNGWETLSKSDLFEMEYWILEQEKLKKDKVSKPMQGKIALVTGAASGIGKACVERLIDAGAVVTALDINPSITTCFNQSEALGIECDVTNYEQLLISIEKSIVHFGGLDMLVTNAGVFPKSLSIGEMDDETWNKSMDINLTSHQRLIKLCLPYLSLGIDPAIVIIASKNVPAPGP
ncbi:MAG: SDR family NAD(P)-dependent oxidoreductase, partial [Cyclobacteriaceae bacterium]|nr:SDR family NAD(P)-dependent oxidoreductase [Cyclobacteriaceae bacterium]